VWIIDPQLQSVTIHRSATGIRMYPSGDVIEGCEQLLPGFSCPVAELFRSYAP